MSTETDKAAPAEQDKPAETAFVTEWREKIVAARAHWAPVFKIMHECQDFAFHNGRKSWVEAGKYTVPFLRRQLKQICAGLYARNPVAVAERKKRIDTAVWNGDFSQLQKAFDALSAATQGMASDPQALAMAQAVITEAEQVRQTYAMRDRFGKTMEILFEHYLNETEPNFKMQMRQLIYREQVNGVAYLRLGLQRMMQPGHDASARMDDDSSAIAEFQRLAAKPPESGSSDAAMAEFLSARIADDTNAVFREGPIFDFPRSDKVIVDPNCTLLATFTGANWIAEEMDLSCAEIQRVYGVDLKRDGTESYRARRADTGSDSKKATERVWEVQHKPSRLTFTICEASDKFLRAPARPDVQLDRFWTIFPLVLNPVDMDDLIFPRSFVYSAIDGMHDLNSTRQALREHRIANKPKYGVRKGILDEETRQNLQDYESGTVFELTMASDQKVRDILQPFEPYNIDPNMYSDSHIFADAQRSAGMQAAAFATPSGVTATESSISAQNQESAESSDVDLLDDFLSAFAKAMGELMLREVSVETVKRIVGPGAVWPSLTQSEIFEGLELKVRAGSSGRPNQAATLAKLQKAMPFLQYLPNVSPAPLAKRYAEALDLDPEELIIEGLPSIAAVNAVAGKPPPSPTDSPQAQGAQGGGNARAGARPAGEATAQNPVQDLAPGETAGLQ